MAILKLKVLPGAKKNEIVGMWQDMLKVKVTAQPEDGKANKACLGLLSEKFEIPKSKIQLVKGHANREKQIEISDVSEKELKSMIEKIRHEQSD